MQIIQVPASIWLNLVVLAVAALFCWFRIAKGAARKERRKRPGLEAGARMRPRL